MAFDQPKFSNALQGLTNNTTVVVEEFTNLTNQLANVPAQLTDLQTGLNALVATVNTMNTNMNTMNTNMNTMNTNLQNSIHDMNTQITNRMDIMERRNCARIHNANAGTGTLLGLETNEGIVPPNFPNRAQDVRTTMTGGDIDALLTAYGLPTTGRVLERRERLGHFIGVLV